MDMENKNIEPTVEEKNEQGGAPARETEKSEENHN